MAGGDQYDRVMAVTGGSLLSLDDEPSKYLTFWEVPGVTLAQLLSFTSGFNEEALCFNLPTPPRPEEANPDYAAKLREVGRRLGLPPAYVAAIK